jgi:hypothetical protein
VAAQTVGSSFSAYLYRQSECFNVACGGLGSVIVRTVCLSSSMSSNSLDFHTQVHHAERSPPVLLSPDQTGSAGDKLVDRALDELLRSEIRFEELKTEAKGVSVPHECTNCHEAES